MHPMTCDVCAEAATVQVTDVAAGRPSVHWLCREHYAAAAAHLGGPTRPQWDAFFA